MRQVAINKRTHSRLVAKEKYRKKSTDGVGIPLYLGMAFPRS